MKDFFRNPEQTSFQISPDGNYFSYLSPYNNRMNIFISSIRSEGANRITEVDRDIAGYLWANDQRLIYAKDRGGDENFRLYGINIDGSNLVDLTPYDSVRIILIDELREVEDEVIIGMNKDNKALFEPYKINIETGFVIKIAENKDVYNPISRWITDHNGDIRMAIQVVDGVNKNILYRKKSNGPFSTVMTINFEETFNPFFFEFDNSSIVYAASNIGRDKEAIIRYDLDQGKELEELFSHEEVDVSSLEYSKARQTATYASYTTDKTYRHFFDSGMQQIYTFLETKLPDYEVVIVSSDRKEEKFLIRTYSDRSRGGYYFFNAVDSTLDQLVDVSPWLPEEDMSEMVPIKYFSRDSLTIHGYLTLPKGVTPKNLPVVINPHGGPWARDRWGFNPEVQLLASRGYAVLQMNFRGSTGYGKQFWESSFKQWGLSMQDDITDGTKWLIDEGIADPAQIAIYGGSYGGYAALAGVTFTPELYTCAIDYVGVSNLHTFLNALPPYWKPYREMMYAMIGDPVKDSALIAEASPVHFADSIKRPLFVAQGANDPRVNIHESDQIVRAMRSKGVDVPYMVKYDEGHGFRNEENRLEFYNAMVGFLEEHLKPVRVKRKYP
ncbi:MAG: S9 family peptidase [Bacteroidetes bacterium]|nr:S9 family peptidase [Bacteroidota bacterium]